MMTMMSSQQQQLSNGFVQDCSNSSALQWIYYRLTLSHQDGLLGKNFDQIWGKSTHPWVATDLIVSVSKAAKSLVRD